MFWHWKRHRVVSMDFADGRSRRVALPPKWWDASRDDFQDFSDLSAEEQRHVLLAVTDFAYFHHKIFLPHFCASEGKDWPEALWFYLRELCEDYQKATHPKLLAFDVFPGEYSGVWRVCRILPNRMLKTATTSYSLPLWLMGGNNEIRIGVTTGTKDLGKRCVSVVQGHAESNPRYREVFGVLHREGDSGWTDEEIKISGRAREADPTMYVKGWTGAVEGKGLDVAISDDVQNYENAMTAARRAKQWQWQHQVYEKRLDTQARLEIVIQTRHAVDDFAGHIKEETAGAWDYKEYPAISQWPPGPDEFKEQDEADEGYWTIGNLGDPDKWRSRCLCEDVLPLQTLLDEWKPMSGRVAFYRTRLNEVWDPATKWFARQFLEAHARADGGMRPDGTYRPRLRAWDVNIGEPTSGSIIAIGLEQAGIHIVRKVVSIDPAATDVTPGRDPDYTVIQLWGLDGHSHCRILLDMTRFRTGSPKRFRARLKRFLDAYTPDVVVFEANAMAKWARTETRDDLGYPIKAYDKGASAEDDVENFKDLIEDGLLLYCWGDAVSIRKMKPFEVELDEYPQGHDDTLDAAVQAQRYLRPRGEKKVCVRRPQRPQPVWSLERLEKPGIEWLHQELQKIHDVLARVSDG